MKAQQHTEFAVVVSPSGGMPSVINQASNDFWIMQSMGYEVLEQGTKKHCTEYWEQLMEQVVEIEYFA